MLKKERIPNEWNRAQLCQSYKQKEEEEKTTTPNNCKGISKIILDEISTEIQIREDQQSFRRNRSIIDVIFIISQIGETPMMPRV